MGKKDDKIKELERQIAELILAIEEKDAMNTTHLEVNQKMADDAIERNKVIIQLESNLYNYEKIFAKKDKQFERQFTFIQDYRDGLIRLGNSYKADKVCNT